MTLIINGALGRMGTILAQTIQSEGEEIAARIDANAEKDEKEGLFRSLSEYSGEADCIIDFSHHSCTHELLQYATERKIPVVIATTGHTSDEQAEISAASKIIPVFHSGNMSVGIALLVKLAKTAVSAFPDADVEIIEKHHNRKLDVPSGTALMLANAVCEQRTQSRLVVGRHENGKRDKNDIGIHSLRMGNVVGEHELIISTDSQTITLKHESHSRTLFAEGALEAARFICKMGAGLYDMHSMLDAEVAK